VILFFAAVIAAAVGFNFYRKLKKDLPDVAMLEDYRPSLITKIYSDSEEIVGTFFIEKRMLVPFSEIPSPLVQAFISVEDARFYYHRGVDFQGISRAFWENLRAQQITQGGSTITQQLAKTLFLTPERTILRKVREMILAMEIEKRFSKEEILELYLNQIYFGAGAYGVEAAADTYFGKSVDELSLGEMAILAALPKSPSNYDPFKHPEDAKIRRSIVLSRMYAENFITLEEKQQAVQEELLLNNKEKCRNDAAYFVEHVRRYLMNKYGSNRLYNSGLKVYTSLNMDMQAAASKAVREGLREYDKRHGYRGPLGRVSLETLNAEDLVPAPSEQTVEETLICVDAILEGIVLEVTEKGATVQVQGQSGFLPFEEMKWAKKAVPGKRRKDYNPSKITWIEPKLPADVLSAGDRILVKVTQYEPEAEKLILSLEQEPEVQGALIAMIPETGAIKAMIGGYDFEKSEFNRAVQAKRQPGSAFKPIIYGAAMERGFTPASVIIDTPVIFQDDELEEKWKPANYSERFYGPTRLREALAQSRNVVTIKLLQKVGLTHVADFAQRLGIKSPLAMDYSLALGSSVLTLEELTSAYSVFAHQGKRTDPFFVEKILDYDGNVIEEHVPSAKQAIDPEVAFLVTNMMEDVVKHGTGRIMLKLGRPSAGKTGTTNNFLDALYLGFVPDLVAGAWVGYDDMRPLGKSEAGSKAAAPIWLSFMKKATKELGRRPFLVPEGIVFVKVEKETGLLPASADQETYFECFRAGWEPKEFAAVKKTEDVNFFDIDTNPLMPPSDDPERQSMDLDRL
jgi:penicillin-binding protein 1A